MQQCLDVIKNASRTAGGELLDEEAMEILDSLYKEYVKTGNKITSESQVDALKAKAQEIALNARKKAKIQRRSKLINATRYAQLKSLMDKYPNDPGKALQELLVGTLDVAKEGRGNSVGARQHAINLSSAGGLLADLQKKGLVGVFRSGQLDELIYRELFDGIGSTNNKEAQGIAEAIRKAQKRLLRRKNRAGSYINEIPNYVTRQVHNPSRIMDAGAEKWIADILPLLDEEATFKDMETSAERRKFLSEIHNALVTGIHQKTDRPRDVAGKSDPILGFKGPANLAKKLSSERVLHFKDGKSAHKYATMYSNKNLVQSILDGFAHDAQALSLMETFGTNPAAMLDRVLDDLRARQGQDLNMTKVKEKVIRRQFAEVDGSTRNIGASEARALGLDWGAIGAMFRALQNITKLGYSVITSFGDVVTKANFIQTNTGRGFFESYAKSLGDVFKLFPNEQQKELSYMLDIGAEAVIGDVHARFGADDPLPGMMSKAQQTFFKLNGMYYWNNAMKTGVARMLSADLAVHSTKSFSNIPIEVQNILKFYNIGEAELKLIRGIDMKAADGRRYAVPAVVDDIPVERLDAYIRDSLGTLDITDDIRQDVRDDLRTRISTYFTDSADAAIPTPGARERSLLNQGHPRGTVMGEAIRMFTQFKSFPVTFMTKGMGRTYYARQAAGKSGYVGVAQLMVGMTVMGYVSTSIKDILRGKTPMEVFSEDTFLNIKTLSRAFVSGGGAGILGDFLFNEYNRYGKSLTETLAGPGFGTASEVAAIFSSLVRGDFEGTGKKAFDGARGLIPNLFYTDTAMQYLFLYGLSEQISPGFMSKMERNLKKNTGQTYFLPPSQNAIRF